MRRLRWRASREFMRRPRLSGSTTTASRIDWSGPTARPSRRGSRTARRSSSRCRCPLARRSPRASRWSATRRSSSSWVPAVPGCGSTSPARAAWTSWASRRRSGVASDDPAHRPDAHPRRRRAGGLPPRDRRTLPTLPRSPGDGSVLGSRVRVPEPQRHGGEDPRLRRAGILALPEAPVAGPVRALAARGWCWRRRPPALRARALGAPRRRQPRRDRGGAAVALDHAEPRRVILAVVAFYRAQRYVAVHGHGAHLPRTRDPPPRSRPHPRADRRFSEGLPESSLVHALRGLGLDAAQWYALRRPLPRPDAPAPPRRPSRPAPAGVDVPATSSPRGRHQDRRRARPARRTARRHRPPRHPPGPTHARRGPRQVPRRGAPLPRLRASRRRAPQVPRLRRRPDHRVLLLVVGPSASRTS